eukprot:TRINITY_DN51101_c0_g1_i1.p1 TRINITY_DN51101_c0_g1~~TRINITY_DN51101_c0_g1_i1.p1  ORF type:complete len:596 (+),score=97.79 TRINITY_DN51101_c0_g1_i1:84-1871(+)
MCRDGGTATVGRRAAMFPRRTRPHRCGLLHSLALGYVMANSGQGGGLDPSRPGFLKALLQTFARFASLADESGRKWMDLAGLQEMLAEQWKADDAERELPMPEYFVRLVGRLLSGLETVDGQEIAISEEMMTANYSRFWQIRHVYLKQWREQAWKHCWGEDDAAVSAWRACCSVDEGGDSGRQAATCFNDVDGYSFENCCKFTSIPDRLAKDPSARPKDDDNLPFDEPLGALASSEGGLSALGDQRSALRQQCTLQLTTQCSLKQSLIDRADESSSAQPAGRNTSPSGKKLAVLVVGIRERFYPESTLQRVVAPAAAAGYEVDYWALLGWRPHPRARSKSRWSVGSLKTVANPMFANASKEDLLDYVVRRAKKAGAQRATLKMLDPDTDWDPLDADWKRYFGRQSRGHTSFYNALVRLKKVEMLWNMTRDISLEQASEPYSHVLLTRDDIFWVDDLRLEFFPDPWAIYSQAMGYLCAKYPADTELPGDHAIVLGGRAAESYLNVYTEFYNNPNAALTSVASVEDFLYQLASLKGLHWRIVRRDWLPHFLAMHQPTPERPEGPPVFCLRGLKRRRLHDPTDECVHPSKVRYPECRY